MSISATPTTIPILELVTSCRTWRPKSFNEKRSGGFVQTIEGASDEGHLLLVKCVLLLGSSLSENTHGSRFQASEEIPSHVFRALERLAGEGWSMSRVSERYSHESMRGYDHCNSDAKL
ncbi:hypothetical protein BKA82DRAFT_995165 [Pisolithus tinctorius]|uniref:Uncharacterized protein n=1 Tax=Pisolithus tinctorius Marx 270 TaxID=870435 RepID=A0A0C3PP56_PISTI|nr:hypothetical protein BKA82DRAFT_995165 [Pisolithus tinctorius]KIO10686.1 hypothetical protein M404DRAFT_995165 [Pisolithus tinctorius Marx 270]